MSELVHTEADDKLFFWGVLVVGLACGGLFISYTLWLEYRFSQEGVMTEGVVDDKNYGYGRRGRRQRLSIEYTFEGPEGPVRAEEWVIAPVFDSLKPGDTVAVRYVASNPRLSQIWDGGNRRRAFGFAFFGVIFLVGMTRLWGYSRPPLSTGSPGSL